MTQLKSNYIILKDYNLLIECHSGNLDSKSYIDFVKRTIGSQLVRAVDSVGANIAEGYGRGSKLDNSRFVKIARGSLFETKYWLIQANTRKLLSNDDLTEIIAKIDTLLARISAYINYLSKSSQKR